MAVLPPEQVTQRTEQAIVGYSAHTRGNAASETAWHSTTNVATNDVTLTKPVAANQTDRDVISDRVVGNAAGFA